MRARQRVKLKDDLTIEIDVAAFNGPRALARSEKLAEERKEGTEAGPKLAQANLKKMLL
jgi:hypothetical protein